ncbi:beta-propeller domain-containing protein [Phytomonospora sp. NPDC050363]|uniref:beta-propeller domain-containing protein n=1 Tax=Phytomonospora sp. NPDC050363 TaxID=3155642 RepID=UPI0034103F9E
MPPAVVVPLLLVAGLLSACTSREDTADLRPPVDAKLASYDSCDHALTSLREAILPYIGPWGVDIDGGGNSEEFSGPDAAAGDAKGAAPESATDAAAPYSTTNVQEAGIDEPDIVKTDGRRILTLRDGSLRVVDTAGRTVLKDIPLNTPGGGMYYGASSMLLSGDKVLVLSQDQAVHDLPADANGKPWNGATGLQIAVVDLAVGAVTETFSFTGSEVDTRQYGSVVRVVASSSPQLRFPEGDGNDSPSVAAARNRDAVNASTIGDWMPRYRHQGADGQVSEGTVGCESMRHAFSYSATSMLTVLTFDLAGPLGDGAPVSIVADGQTVYGSPSALYVANDRRAFAAKAAEAGTELYRFDVSQPGPPVYAASGTVPGYVLNQYSMSEFEGHLRVATTSDPFSMRSGAKSHSGVYVFKQDGEGLVEVGRVEGLGRDEQIYAVRYVGPTAYVVTFRQTDPLYVVDLSVPAAPKVDGELKITGFSSYLHPVGPGRLIGVGQEATETGMATAAQISLFDVSNPAAPGKLADYEVSGATSEAQYDPHAFLYWEPTRLLVVPIGPSWTFDDGGENPGGALLLRVEDTGLTKVGVVAHEGADLYASTINRSLIVGETLWTLSYAGLKATDLTGKTELAWIAA